MRTDPERRARRGRASTRHGADAGEQLVLAEWLGDVVVGPGVERLDLGRLLALAGEDDDRRRAAPADLAAHGDAVEAGHGEVEDHEVGALGVVAAQRLVAVVGGAHPVADAADERRDGADHGRLVVDDEDPQAHRGRAPPASAVTNWLPPAGLSSIHSRPPMAATSRRAANRPTPVPGLVGPGVEPDERLEDALAHRWRDARSVVADRDVNLAVGAPVGDDDLRARRRVLGGVLEQQLQHLGQAGRIAQRGPAVARRSARADAAAGAARAGSAPRRSTMPTSNRRCSTVSSRSARTVSRMVSTRSFRRSSWPVAASCQVADLVAASLRRLGQQVEVGADHRQRCAQLVRDDRDQLGARLVDAAQAVELRLRLEVQPAPLDDAGQERGDRRQAPDLGRVEVAARLGLHVQDADDAVAHLERHGQDRGEALVVDAADPRAARVVGEIGADDRAARARPPGR